MIEILRFNCLGGSSVKYTFWHAFVNLLYNMRYISIQFRSSSFSQKYSSRSFTIPNFRRFAFLFQNSIIISNLRFASLQV